MNNTPSIQLVECPRDAMQGWPHLIDTSKKIAYLQQLLSVGFDTIDIGSFVSAKAIPQMADTAQVLDSLDLSTTRSRLLVIVANERGALEALQYASVHYLGYPFSISETFQQRNTRSSMLQSLDTLASLQSHCVKTGRQLVVYLSMAFGNPYGDPYHSDLVLDWARRMIPLGITFFSLADTVGLATPEQVGDLTADFIKEYPHLTTGLHLHARPDGWEQKVAAGLAAGCARFDAAIGGFGGCPMAGDSLVGNVDTIRLHRWLLSQERSVGLDQDQLHWCGRQAASIFV